MTTIAGISCHGLRGFIDAAGKLGELRCVGGADWDLELDTITEVVNEALKGAGKN